LLLIAAGFQFALWGLAAHALSDSVAQGGATLRAEGATSASARSVTLSEIKDIAGGLTLDPTVSVTLDDGTASLVASASVPSLLTGIHIGVSAVSSGPAQQFRASG
jgi:hypothetical protein